MTSTPVMGSESLLKVSFMDQTTKSSKSDLGNFKDFLNQSKTSGCESGTVENKKPAVKVEHTTTNAKIKEKVETETVKTEEASTVDKDNQETLIEEVKDAVSKVIDEIKNELDVTDEEIMDVLSTLGLTAIALLDETKMPEIVAELTQSEDTMTIITNQDLYESLGNIVETVEETVESLAASMEVSVEELKEAIVNEENVPKEEPVSFADTLKNAKETEAVTGKAETFEEKITINDNRDNKETVNTKDTVETAKTETRETVITDKAEPKKEESKNEESHDSHGEAKDNSMTGFVNNIIQKAAEAIKGETAIESYKSYDTQNVLNQITESIRFDLSNDVNEVNIRLHPETLGTVNVKVTANSEGVMTAQFTAQNEEVKNIIENQAVVLRETLEAKGVTVEAVEVVIQSHEFERNLNEQNKGQHNEERSTKRTRRINLSEDMEDELSPEDDLIRKMMAQNGNTIDYSA